MASVFCYLNIKFQSTLPSQGATDDYNVILKELRISIHAPLTGSDYDKQAEQCVSYISIHAPLTGSDLTDSRNGAALT